MSGNCHEKMKNLRAFSHSASYASEKSVDMSHVGVIFENIYYNRRPRSLVGEDTGSSQLRLYGAHLHHLTVFSNFKGTNL